jgi:hypothetical protein
MNWYVWILVFATMAFIAVEAVVRQVNSCLSLRNLIDRHEYVVVLLYQAHCRSYLKDEKFLRLLETFNRLSQRIDYRDAGVVFAKANTKDKEIENFAQEYAVEDFPAFLLFKKGRLCGSDHKRAIIYGFPIQTELVSFINEWIGVEVTELAQEENERRERECNATDVSISYLIAPGWGYYPPWYAGHYWDWPAYRPGFYGGFGHNWRSGGGRRHR